jgi:DNA-binding Xre family transcriptional regulator
MKWSVTEDGRRVPVWVPPNAFLIEAMLDAGYETQRQLAAASGIHEVQLSRLVHGHTMNPSSRTLARLSKALGCNALDLFAQTKKRK